MAERLSLPELEEFRKLDQERERARERAQNLAVAKGEEAVLTLKELGFIYSFAPADMIPTTDKPKGTHAVKDGPCSVCGFKTAPLHHARSHRGQEPKRAFTIEELAIKNMSRV